MILIKKCTVIVGMKGSGKSVAAHFIAEQKPYKTLIYDTIWEFPYNHNKYDVYRPRDRYSTDELIGVINSQIKGKNKYNLFMIDEANRFIPGGGARLRPEIVDLNDIQRHPPYSIGTVWIARRMTQIHPDVVGLADNLLIFNLVGRNDVRYLNDIKQGLGDEVAELKPFHAIIYSKGTIDYWTPVEVDNLWNQKRS